MITKLSQDKLRRLGRLCFDLVMSTFVMVFTFKLDFAGMARARPELCRAMFGPKNRVDTPKFSLQILKTKLVLFESPYLCEKNEGSFIKIGKILPKLFHFQTTKKPLFQGIISLARATKK